MKNNSSSTPETELDSAPNSIEARMPGNSDSCPACSSRGAREWLRAPDRFHGRGDRYTLLRCPSCSLVWLSDPPSPEEMGQHYTEAYDRLISSSGENSPRRWRDRNAVLSLHCQSGALLDLGCSSGAFLQTLQGGNWDLFGIEMSPDSAQQAHASSGATVFAGNILDARFAAESFDVITCFDVLEHLYEPRRILERVGMWLKPGGIFYVLVPNIDSAESRVFGSYWHGLELPRHLSHFSPRSLEALAASAGLVTVSLETHRNQAVGTSLRYLCDDAFQKIGIRRKPVAYRGEASLPWRAARKVVRMTALRVLLAMAPLAGGGESIHAVFSRKEINP